jgi:hypothetical protein
MNSSQVPIVGLLYRYPTTPFEEVAPHGCCMVSQTLEQAEDIPADRLQKRPNLARRWIRGQ